MQARIKGVTPSLPNGLHRGYEILEWIEENKYAGDYLVLDDDCSDIKGIIPDEKFLHIPDGFIKNGLTKEMVNNVIQRKK